jgi:glycosyltransferase involved in cell wall biosynthesis
MPGKPWWWEHIDHDSLECIVEHHPIIFEHGKPAGPLSPDFARLFAQCVRVLARAQRGRYAFIFTFECDWSTYIFAALQTITGQRWPRHVVLQFIMREGTLSIRSRMKYAFMRWCFRSIYRFVCSSRSESEYYVQAFGWKPERVAFVPFHTDPAILARPPRDEERFVLSAGRTFRDYPTLLEALRHLDIPVTIVASPSSVSASELPAHVTLSYDMPLDALIDLMARSIMVVLPLQEREISIGQSVLLEAMAMGKAVIVTRVNGTLDYVEHMKTGVLVPPRDVRALREAVELLAYDPALRQRLGQAAREAVARMHLPAHYAAKVAAALRGATPAS